MAIRPKLPCGYIGCPELVEPGEQYCTKHKKLVQKQTDERRGSANERGYDYRWRKYSKRFLSRPENILCNIRLSGCTRVAECVDHIIPPAGADDPLFWDTSNHQPACIHCNSVKGNKTL